MSTNSAEQLIYEAARLLEEEGDAEAAIAALQEAADLAVVARRQIELVRARTMQGELLLELGRDEEARGAFEDVIAVGSVLDPEVAGEEVASARQHLAMIAGPPKADS